MKDNKREKVIVRVGGREAEIDRQLAPLIEALWEVGVATVASGRDDDRSAWVEFYSEADLKAFLDRAVAFEAGGGTLYDRVLADVEDAPGCGAAWRFGLIPADWNSYREGEVNAAKVPDRPTDFGFFYLVRFPLADLPALTERLRQAGGPRLWVGPSAATLAALPDGQAMRYYDFRRHWTKRVEPHLGDAELNAVLVRDFGKFRAGFGPGMFPHDFENCDWWVCRRDDWFGFRSGPMPRFWKYVKHAACHWLVNFALRLAYLTEPGRPWRVISSDLHSTVWDGKTCLFDLNFQALGVSPAECWELANERGLHLPPGVYLKVGGPDHRARAAMSAA